MVEESLRVRMENSGWGGRRSQRAHKVLKLHTCVCVCVCQSGGHDGGAMAESRRWVVAGAGRDGSGEASVLSRSHGKQLWLRWISGICCWNSPLAAISSLNECLRPPPPSGVS